MAKKKKSKKSRSPRKAKKPPPMCKALLLCQKTIIEAVTGNVSIIGTFSRFHLPSIPGQTGPFTVFMQLTDGIGRYDVVIDIEDLRRNVVLGRGSGLGVNWPEKLLTLNLMIPIPSLTMTHAGVYDLVVLANGQEIERQKFEVVEIQRGSR